MRVQLIFFIGLAMLGNIGLAQTSPAGVGASVDIETWLDASRLTLSDNDPVASWTDFSASSNSATQGTAASQPLFRTNQLNGHPAILFDGSDDFLDFSSNITNLETTTFFVFSEVSPLNLQAVLNLENHLFYARSNSLYAAAYGTLGSAATLAVNRNAGFSIFSASTDNAVGSSNLFMTAGSNTTTLTRTGFFTSARSSVGVRVFGETLHMDGMLSEVIVYNQQLNSAQRKIVSNYLGAKYNLTPEESLYSFGSTHGRDVFGIGQESDGSNTDARGIDSLQVNGASGLGDGEYLLIGNDNGSFATSTSVGAEASGRWTKIYRADQTGDVGTVDLTFYIGANDFAGDPNNYVVLIESGDGDFSNGGTTIQETGRVYDGVNNTVSFTGITLSNGDYFTLAEKTGVAPMNDNIDFGPGGVGSTMNLEAWLDASRLTLTNNDPVSSWTDLSGSNNNATQGTAASQPLFQTNQLNSQPAILFDGSDDFLDFTSNITNLQTTTFFVFSEVNPVNLQTVLNLENHLFYARSNSLYATAYGTLGSAATLTVNRNAGFSIFSASTDNSVGSSNLFLTAGSNTITRTRTGFFTSARSSIGIRVFGETLHMDGMLSEVIVFNEELNSAKRKIVSNYLGAKYNLTPEQSLYSFGSTHGRDVFGIGQESDGNHTDARGIDSLQVNGASGLGDGEYLLIGNDNGSFATSNSVGAEASQRWTKIYRADQTGDVGTVDLTFYLGANDFAGDPNNYVVLIENNDGDFSNGSTSIQETGRVYDGANNTVAFTGITISDGDYFTLAEKTGVAPTSDSITFGPGGVGSTANLETWLDASSLTLTNNDPVSSWTDLSGSNKDANQTTAASQPLFQTNQLNGHPAILFDGSNDFLDFTSNITNLATTTFFVFSEVNPVNLQTVLNLDNHLFYARSNSLYATAYGTLGSAATLTVNRNAGFSVFSASTDNSVGSSNLFLTAGSNTITRTRTGFFTSARSSIGVRVFGETLYMDGRLAEVIVFNEELNSAKRKIVSNYLAAKYNLTAEQNLYAFGSTHGNFVVGIGQESDGSHTLARSPDTLEISNASSLGNGDYLLVGNDAGNFSASTSVPAGIDTRWTRVWRADVTNTPGTVDIKFFLNGNTLSGATDDYTLLIDTDGDFSNGGTTLDMAGTFNASEQSVSFTGVSFSDGDFFTLGIEGDDINAIATGTWDSPSTWDCTCIPQENESVIIGSPFTVSIDSKSDATNVTITTGGTLTFTTNDTLDLNGWLMLSGGTLNTNSTGTVAMTGITGQTISSNTSSLTEFNNLFVNNSNGVTINSGSWSLSNSLQVSSGNLDVTGADSVVLASNATKTSQILQSVNGAFTGTFKVERYISNRSNNFANISSTVESTTVADLDDDLLLSGVNGNNGNAGSFNSMLRYDRPTDSHIAITSTATALTPGEGYEVFLGTTSTMFTDEGFALEGVPNTGTISTTIDQNFNLVGNPYHSFIDFDAMDKTNIDDVYYIFNSSTGSYSTFNAVSKPPIAAAQGFWVNKSTAGSVSFDFQETHKVDNTSSAFVRRKQRDVAEFKLYDANHQERHTLSLEFNAQSSNELDPKDIKHLPSPFDHIPQITSKAQNSNVDLVGNSLNSFEDVQIVPINIKAEDGEQLTIISQNFDAIQDNYSCAYLKDNSTGDVIDMAFENEINFSANENANRFNLVLSNSYEECQKALENEIIDQAIDHSLSLRNINGEWYLNFNLSDDIHNLTISLYNMNGQLISADQTITVSGEGNFLLNNLNPKPGIYLIQVKGEDLFLNKSIRF